MTVTAPKDQRPAADDASSSSVGSAPVDWARRRWPHLLMILLAALPALHMLTVISRGSHVQFTDYWVFLSELIEPDGSVRFRAFTEFQGQHLLSVPQLIYLANIWLFGGSNIALGYVVVAVVAAQLVILWRWLEPIQQLPFAMRAALLILASALLYSPHGAWNYILAMSGTAWLTANLMVLLSIHLATRGRTRSAVLLALVATVTYGTGVLAWPVILLVVIARRRSWGDTILVLVSGLIVVSVYVWVRTEQVRTATIRSPDPWDVLTKTLTILGRLTGFSNTLMLIGGGMVLVILLVTVPLSLRRCKPEAVPFVGVAVYAILATAQIAYGRVGGFGGNTSRYASLSALAGIATAVLVVLVVRSLDLGRWNRAALGTLAGLVVVAAVTAPWHGHSSIRHSLDESDRLKHLSDAQRLKISRDHRWFLFIEQPDVDDRLQRIGHHPFDTRWNADCGLLGQEFDRPLGEVDGSAARYIVGSLPDGVQVRATVALAPSEIACVTLLDKQDVVVGVGRVAFDSDAVGGTDVLAYAPRGAELTTLVIHLPGEDRWVGLPVHGDHGP